MKKMEMAMELLKLIEIESNFRLWKHQWLASFFTGQAHRTAYNGETSSTRSISASIVQGSSVGAASYAVTAADLKPVHTGNSFVKFADDTYLVVPADCVDSRAVELDNIEVWASENNLRLNKLKTREIVFYDNRRRSRVQPPPPLPDVARDNTLKILGVTFSSNLSAYYGSPEGTSRGNKIKLYVRT
jgi:hypothetical protein